MSVLNDPEWRLLDDMPEERQTHLWGGVKRFAQRLAKVIPKVSHTTPVLVHGDWGAGKTTVLKVLANDLPTVKGDAPRTVWFDAWRYDSAGALLPGLVRAVWEAAQERPEDKPGLALLARGVAAAVAVGQKLVPKVASNLSNDLVGDAIEATLGMKRGVDAPADPTRVLLESFDAILRGGWGEIARPILLIDDLDRCRPDHAVALLDGVRMLAANADRHRCRFVVALDRGVVAEAIQQKFSGISGYDGNRYLEKVFPVSFAVPTPHPKDMGTLLDIYCPPLGDAISADTVDALRDAFQNAEFANPRLLKRVVNQLALVSALGIQVEDTVALAKWAVATARWPILRRIIRTYDSTAWTQLIDAVVDQTPVSEPLTRTLLAERGARLWLRKNLAASIDAFQKAEANLRDAGL